MVEIATEGISHAISKILLSTYGNDCLHIKMSTFANGLPLLTFHFLLFCISQSNVQASQ